jgi:hypothetical protein
MHPDNKIVSFVVITASYLRFSYAFRPRRESATFLLATMLATGVVPFLQSRVKGRCIPWRCIPARGTRPCTDRFRNVGRRVRAAFVALCASN